MKYCLAPVFLAVTVCMPAAQKNDFYDNAMFQFALGDALVPRNQPCMAGNLAPGTVGVLPTSAVTINGISTGTEFPSTTYMASLAVNGTLYMAKSSDGTQVFAAMLGGGTPSSFIIKFRPPGGSGSNDDVITIWPNSSCGGAQASFTTGGFEASMPVSSCFPNTISARRWEQISTSVAGQEKSCITPVTW